ncbi:hypothetical protein J1N35_043031 [Gossypium stocksii]|uniref:Uncharacterized protein n=1 Tax=Gossypium stocksii TaxID=47602 RepID=A0A9D3U6N9_9ROSI|nr:hypothetical protein J1N35_043031 [Gossypium stocksii]
MSLKEEIEAMMAKIEELELELAMHKATMGKWILASILKQRKMDVLKSKEFKGTRSIDERRGSIEIRTWEVFQKKLKKQFYP